MVETSATSRSFPGWDAVPEDIIPDVDDTRDLGSEEKNWAALWVVLAFVTSITIGGIVNITTIDSWLFINASSYVNGSMNISENLFVDGNITASYYYGDGSNLSNVNFTELDPYWTGNQSSYFNTTDILGFGYYNSTDFDIADYLNLTTLLSFGYYNSTDFDITDYLLSADWNATNASYYLASNPFGYYNSTDFDIADYSTTATITGWGYYNSSDFDIADYLLSADWNATNTSYYLATNPFTFWNDTYATFNKTYADTLYLTSFTELDPYWTGNSTLVPYLASINNFTANQNLTNVNISAIDCILFDSGGTICSGV